MGNGVHTSPTSTARYPKENGNFTIALSEVNFERAVDETQEGVNRLTDSTQHPAASNVATNRSRT